MPELSAWFGLHVDDCVVMPTALLDEYISRLSKLPPIGGHLGEYKTT